MRYFIDTEFLERPGVLELISIGIVADDGREFHAASLDFDQETADEWLRGGRPGVLGLLRRRTGCRRSR